MARRFQFSLRQFILAMAVVGLLLSLLGGVIVRQRADARRSTLTEPIISQYNAAVALRNDQIVLLDGDAESNLFDGFVTIAELNDAGYARTWRGDNLARAFDDTALAEIVEQHDAIEVLDLRNTAVSAFGLRYLESMPKLRWLAVDAAHCDATGMEHLARLSRLEKLMVDGDPGTSNQDSLRQALEQCEIRSRQE